MDKSENCESSLNKIKGENKITDWRVTPTACLEGESTQNIKSNRIPNILTLTSVLRVYIKRRLVECTPNKCLKSVHLTDL